MSDTRGAFSAYRIIVGFLIVLFIAACGGGGGGGGSSDGDSGGDTVLTPGRITVDGHLISEDFATPYIDTSVIVTYFNPDGSISSTHELNTWTGDTLTYGTDEAFTHDAGGNVLRIDGESTYTREAAGGLYEHLFTRTDFTYTAAGLPETETLTVTSADMTGDGVYDDIVNDVRHVKTYTYDGENRLTELVVDEDGDSQFTTSNDTVTTYTYDAGDRVVRKDVAIATFYTNVYTYTHDGAGRVATETKYATLADHGASDAERVITYTYDASGDLVREEWDTGVANSSDATLDGVPDEIYIYVYGDEGDIQEMSHETIYLSVSERSGNRYVYDVTDGDDDGTPEFSAAYSLFTGVVTDTGGGYPSESLPTWYTTAETNLNDGDDSDGWGVDWSGHSTGTCSTCGNMIGQVNTILLGF